MATPAILLDDSDIRFEYLPASGWVSDTHSTISVNGTTHSPTSNVSTATLIFAGQCSPSRSSVSV